MSVAGAVRRARVAVLAVGLPWIAVNVALRIPPARNVTGVWRDRIFLGGMLLMLVGVLAMLALIPFRWRLARYRQVGFVLNPAQPSFVVPPAPVFVRFWGAVGVFALASSGGTLVLDTALSLDPAVSGYRLAFRLPAYVLVGLTALVFWYIVFRSPDLRLTVTELVVRKPYGRYTVPWEAMAPGGPWPPAQRARELALYVRRPELIRSAGLARRRPGWVPIELPGLAVDPSFLADVIRSYVEHPERRSGIGTATEHDRLLALHGTAVASGVDGR